MNFSSFQRAGKPKVSQTKEGHALCQYENPVTFCYKAGDQKMKAQITLAEEDGTKWSYHVNFADGYKGISDVDKESNRFLERGHTSQNTCAKAVNDDLLLLYQFNPHHPPFWLAVPVKKVEKSVRVKAEKSGYAVFFDSDFRFFFHNLSGQWKADTIDHPKSYIVCEIRDAVLLRLGQEALN